MCREYESAAFYIRWDSTAGTCFRRPAIAGGMLFFGLVAVNLAGLKPAWTFETEGLKEHRPGVHESGWHSERRGAVPV